MKFLQRLLAAAAVAAWSGAVGVDAVKLMPFGDSITELGCWRAMLWQKLQTAGYTSVDFVGSGRSTTECNIAGYDADHEGHSSYLATIIADYNQLVGWLSYANPDIVVMHLGTNDQSQSKTTQQVLDAYTKMVGQMRANNPKMKILVAKIIPMYLSWCTACLPGIVALNSAIGPWATQLSTSDSPITVVDQYTGFDTTADTVDGIHPNLSGDQKIANNWYPAVVAALGGTTPPVTSTTTTRTTTTTTRTTSTSTATSSTRTTSTTATATQTGALVPAWGQCGGIGWTGGTVCVSGYTCKVSNPYYSQCLT